MMVKTHLRNHLPFEKECYMIIDYGCFYLHWLCWVFYETVDLS